jgi:DinB family protein
MPRMPAPRQAHARPSANEYAPHYHTYVSLVTTDDVLGALDSQRLQTSQLLAARSERDGNFRYAPGKWSVKEVIGHLSDAERIFSYRALRIARGDATPLATFDQDDYIRSGNFGERTLADLSQEFSLVRAASIALFGSLADEAWARRGVASEKEVTVRAMAYIIAGHELHHRNILAERYFPAIPRA